MMKKILILLMVFVFGMSSVWAIGNGAEEDLTKYEEKPAQTRTSEEIVKNSPDRIKNGGEESKSSSSSSSSGGGGGGGSYQIIPEGSDSAANELSQSKPGEGIWTKYNQKANSISLGDQFASGVMNWDTILNYVVYLVRFLFGLGLVVGAVMIIYAGYKYAMGVYSGNVSEGNTAVKRAILGVVIVLFSYAMMKALTSVFL